MSVEATTAFSFFVAMVGWGMTHFDRKVFGDTSWESYQDAQIIRKLGKFMAILGTLGVVGSGLWALGMRMFQ